jgi:hypothetical protein
VGGTVVTDLAFFTGATGGSSAADSLTDWTGSGLAVDTVQFVQGTGSISSYLAAASTTRYWSFSCVPTDVSGKAIYFWFALGKVAWLKTKAAGGLTLKLTDASGNWALWNVAGSDTLPHNGFICHCVHTSVPPDSQSATPPDLTRITSFEIRANGSFPGKAYLWVDAVRYGTYVQIKGGDATSPATFEDIYAAESDVNNRWGVLDKVNGIYFVQGKLYIGSTTYGESTYFEDANQVVVFKQAIVPPGFYEIAIQGNAGATTKVYFGRKVGDKGVSGCAFRTAPGATPFKFTASDPNITELGIYGCSFFDASTIELPAYSDTREVLSTSFEACAPVKVSTCRVKYCNFINADDAGAEISSTTLNLTNSSFVGCPYGVRITAPGTYVFDALTFSGNTVDIDNASGGRVEVQCVNGSNPTTYTGDTTIINVVYVTVKVVDPSLNPIEGAQVWVYNVTDGSVIMNKATDANGVAQATVNYTGDKQLKVNVRKSTPPATRYLPSTTYGALTSSGFSTTVVLYPDLVASS